VRRKARPTTTRRRRVRRGWLISGRGLVRSRAIQRRSEQVGQGLDLAADSRVEERLPLGGQGCRWGEDRTYPPTEEWGEVVVWGGSSLVAGPRRRQKSGARLSEVEFDDDNASSGSLVGTGVGVILVVVAFDDDNASSGSLVGTRLGESNPWGDPGW
jgi:hypothetical protein